MDLDRPGARESSTLGRNGESSSSHSSSAASGNPASSSDTAGAASDGSVRGWGSSRSWEGLGGERTGRPQVGHPAVGGAHYAGPRRRVKRKLPVRRRSPAPASVPPAAGPSIRVNRAATCVRDRVLNWGARSTRPVGVPVAKRRPPRAVPFAEPSVRPESIAPADFPAPEARRRAVAEVLARGVRRHLSITLPGGAFSAGRSSGNPSETPPSGLASGPDKSVTVHAG